MNTNVVDAARNAFNSGGPTITLGAVVHEGACHPEPVIRIPLSMMNRHGLIAGATGTGKTKSLQLIAEQLAAQGFQVERRLIDLHEPIKALGVYRVPIRLHADVKPEIRVWVIKQ
jgi:hypothetical protein